jgi:hypothetical protein
VEVDHEVRVNQECNGSLRKSQNRLWPLLHGFDQGQRGNVLEAILQNPARVGVNFRDTSLELLPPSVRAQKTACEEDERTGG